MECTPTTVYTPTNDSPVECPEGLFSTNCTVTPTPIVYLGLSANATQTAINNALVSALISKDQLIAELTTRIEALEA